MPTGAKRQLTSFSKEADLAQDARLVVIEHGFRCDAIELEADQRILLEPRGTRRLSSQTMLDLRVSRAMPFGRFGRAELLLDVLNLLNESAEEAIASDNAFSSTVGQSTVFVDPRRVMVSVRVNLNQ